MTPRARRLALAVCLALPGAALLAGPGAPVTAPGIELVELGIFCQADTAATEAAPETSLGYITLLDRPPELAFRQQEVPARIGVQFGVIVQSDQTISGVRNETWMPGAERPEVWYVDLLAGRPQTRGFLFEYPEELRIGTWRMDAFDDDTLLYSVEWEVLPGDALPGVGSDCGLLS